MLGIFEIVSLQSPVDEPGSMVHIQKNFRLSERELPVNESNIIHSDDLPPEHFLQEF
jgi:hypothetical protein